MTFITVNKQTTTNTKPTITGTVKLDRAQGETINIRLNYVTYELFGGNLGINEKVTPNIWTIELDDPLEIGIYDVEAYVLDSTGRIIASDDTSKDLSIYVIPQQTQQQTATLAQKMSRMNQLMQSMNILSAALGSSVGGPHPATNDDSSTHLHGRGKEESNKSAEEKDYKKKKVKKNPVAKKNKNEATKSGNSLDGQAIDDKEFNEAQYAAKAADAGNDSEYWGGENTPDGVIDSINKAAAAAPPISLPTELSTSVTPAAGTGFA